jgi:hypothetical protein
MVNGEAKRADGPHKVVCQRLPFSRQWGCSVTYVYFQILNNTGAVRPWEVQDSHSTAGRVIPLLFHCDSFLEWLVCNQATWSSFAVLIIKPTSCTNFSNLFLDRTLHVSDSFSVHHQDPSTVHTAIGICHTGYADCLLENCKSSSLSVLFNDVLNYWFCLATVLEEWHISGITLTG